MEKDGVPPPVAQSERASRGGGKAGRCVYAHGWSNDRIRGGGLKALSARNERLGLIWFTARSGQRGINRL